MRIVPPHGGDIITNLIVGSMEKVTKRVSSVMDHMADVIIDPLKGTQRIIGSIVGSIHKHILKPMIKSDKKKYKLMGGAFKAMGKIGMGVLGILLMVLEKMGILKPILAIINALFAILGSKILIALMPLIMQLMDILLSDETMALMDALAELLVALLEPLFVLAIELLPILIPIITGLVSSLNTHLIPALQELNRWIKGISNTIDDMDLSGGSGGGGSGGQAKEGSLEWWGKLLSGGGTGSGGGDSPTGGTGWGTGPIGFQGGGIFNQSSGLAWLHGPEIVEPYGEYKDRNRALLNSLDILNLQMEEMSESNKNLIHYLRYET